MPSSPRKRPAPAGDPRDPLMSVCAELPGASLGYPFTPDTAVFTVAGKIFALLGVVAGRPSLSVKADPERVTALVAGLEAVTPGYHLNKRHWLTVDLTGEVPDGLTTELVEDSYDLVVASLPKKDRPYLAPFRD